LSFLVSDLVEDDDSVDLVA